VSVKCPHCQAENADDTYFCSNCAAPLFSRDDEVKIPPQDSFLPHFQFERGLLFAGRYEVIDEVGRGGMGRVYRVLDRKVDEEVALKIIRPEVAGDKKTVERFRNELRLARKISHRNICRVYHFGEEEGVHFLTMEHIHGESLKNMLRMTKHLSVGTALQIAGQMADGLAEAHSRGVVHRDLKPGNVMLEKDGNVKIMDFGLAHMEAAGDGKETRDIAGTPEYMSPEQIDGRDVDGRSDLYSLGVILFEMLTGKLPFEGETPLDVAFKHKNEEPADPQDFNPLISDDVCRLILKCLEKDKNRRFENAQSLASELKSLANEVPVSQFPAYGEHSTPLKNFTSSMKRNGIWAAVVLVVLVGIVAGLQLLKKRAPMVLPEIKMLVVLPFENMGGPEDDYFVDGLTEEITSRLSFLQGLGVISRTSAKQYKNTGKNLRQIGKELGVDYILEGTVQWNRSSEGEERVLVRTQLFRTSDNTHLWSERFERIIGDIFTLQSEIAEKVIQKLDLNVLEPERQLLMANPTTNAQAYDYYLRGRQQAGVAWNTSDVEDYEEAVRLLTKAVELDSRFTFAYITLSITHQWAYANGVDRTEDRLNRARDAVFRALEIEPDLPDAQLALGFFYYRGYHDYERALEIFESVYRARPNLPYTYLGYILRRQGRWTESNEILEEAFKLSPLNADLAYQIGRSYTYMRRYEEAADWFDRAISIDANYYFPLLAKARIPLLSEGNLEEARAKLRQLPPHQLTDYTWYVQGLLERKGQEVIQRLSLLSYDVFVGNTFYVPVDLALASAYSAVGDSYSAGRFADSARLLLEESVEQNPEDPRFHASLGLALAHLGRKEEAVREGSRAVEILPVSKDFFDGPHYVRDLAEIYTLTGEYGKAIEQLEYLMSIQAGTTLSSALLRIDPLWDPLRGFSRFQQLLDRGD
jgi:serine/threonine protein kinase/tetratricopeptide (TPR) repeat protein